MQKWMRITVETEIEWPAEETTVEYKGDSYTLLPPTDEFDAEVRMRYDDPSEFLKTVEKINRFLTALSWWNRQPAKAKYRQCITHPTALRISNKVPTPLIKHFKFPSEFQEPTDPKAKLCLALYREAMSMRYSPFKFLGYFKIINTVEPKKFAKWINDNIHVITNETALERIAKIKLTEPDVGEYLYVSSRCAAVHTFCDPVADPDNPADVFRISEDIPIVKAFAEYIIEKIYNVKWVLSR
jgi:hypothetical protein